MDHSPPGSSVHGISQAMEWVAISFSRESSQSRDRTQVSCIVGRRFCCLSHQGFRVIKKQVSVASFNISQYVNKSPQFRVTGHTLDMIHTATQSDCFVSISYFLETLSFCKMGSIYVYLQHFCRNT